jgi:ribosomal protein L11 methyltransferase
MDYYKVQFELNELHPWKDLLIYELGELEYESFDDEDEGFNAYVPSASYNEEAIQLLTDKYSEQIKSSNTELIKGQNWNANWEANFQPVTIGKDLMIKAPFHESGDEYKHVVEIQPKMSFGTGHHQTTKLISTFLLNEPSIPGIVLDMGCGTGVLAILAKKLGAIDVVGIDIEEWAYENSIENAERNNCSEIKFHFGGVEQIPEKHFGLILANINKNILLKQMETYYSRLEKGGQLVLSGFFQSDVQDLVTFGEQLGFSYVKEDNDENWAMLVLKK